MPDDPRTLKLRADYVYIGSKIVSSVEVTAEELSAKPWKYRRVYSKGGAQVWKIL